MKDPKRTQELAELERRALHAARADAPASELSARMARGLGLSAAALLAVQQTAPEAQANALSQATHSGSNAASGLSGAGGSATSVGAKAAALSALPWVGGGVVLAVLGGLTLTMLRDDPPPAEGPGLAGDVQTAGPVLTETPVLREPAVLQEPGVLREPAVLQEPAVLGEPDAVATLPTAQAQEPGTHPVPERRGATKTQPVSALREEIALIDAARAALRAGTPNRALTLANDYLRRYGHGSFLPEASALKIEALVKAGRKAEARALAERFVQQRPGTPLAERVARLAELGSR